MKRITESSVDDFLAELKAISSDEIHNEYNKAGEMYKSFTMSDAASIESIKNHWFAVTFLEDRLADVANKFKSLKGFAGTSIPHVSHSEPVQLANQVFIHYNNITIGNDSVKYLSRYCEEIVDVLGKCKVVVPTSQSGEGGTAVAPVVPGEPILQIPDYINTTIKSINMKQYFLIKRVLRSIKYSCALFSDIISSNKRDLEMWLEDEVASKARRGSSMHG